MDKTYVFFGGDTQVGTTMIAQSVAELLVKLGKTTLLVLASGEYGTDYISGKQEMSLDDIKSNIINNQLKVEDVKGIMYDYNNLKVIPGIKNISTLKYYGSQDIEILLKPLEKLFDYIIIDGGSNVQYGLSISALKNASYRFYIVTQQEKCLRRFCNLYSSLLNPLDYKGSLIINKYNSSPAFYTKKQVESITGLEGSQTISYLEYGWQAEADQCTLLKYGKFCNEIGDVVSKICGERMEEKKGLFNLRGRL